MPAAGIDLMITAVQTFLLQFSFSFSLHVGDIAGAALLSHSLGYGISLLHSTTREGRSCRIHGRV